MLALGWLLLVPFYALAADAAHGAEEQVDILAPRFDLGIWTIVVFALLLFVLRKYAWDPMLVGLHRREQSILDAIEDAKRARAEADALRQQFQADMAQAESRVSAMIEEGRRNAARAAEEETARARATMQEERERMHRELQLAKDQALQELWNQTANLATVISGKAIQRQLNLDDHRRLVDEALRELNQRSGDWKQQQLN
jgi:F-type H+-transporting ATPase subunit b